MSAYYTWRKRVNIWREGHSGDEGVLRATATYLHESADWITVRDFLITMAMTKHQILGWFRKNDFPDFEKAVSEGWGWPCEMEDDTR